jgi:hypothetical protein
MSDSYPEARQKFKEGFRVLAAEGASEAEVQEILDAAQKTAEKMTAVEEGGL